MSYLRGKIVTYSNTHRVHDYMVTVATLSAALAIGTRAVLGLPPAKYVNGSYGSFGSRRFALNFTLPVWGLLEAWHLNIPVTNLEIVIVELPSVPPPPPRLPSAYRNETMYYPIFVKFFEDHRPWVEENVGKIDKWPSTFAFSRVVRNAISHGGNLHLIDKKAKPVTWHNLTYDLSHHGRALHDDLAVGDLLFLMMEAADELDKAGCPLHP
jgi:hypothetical protein